MARIRESRGLFGRDLDPLSKPGKKCAPACDSRSRAEAQRKTFQQFCRRAAWPDSHFPKVIKPVLIFAPRRKGGFALGVGLAWTEAEKVFRVGA